MSVFLGWMPDQPAQACLGALVEELQAAMPPDAPAHAWRNPQQWHVTLRFLGDSASPEERARISRALDTAMHGVAAFDAGIAALQYWPGARVLVATLASSPAMDQLLVAAETCARSCGYAAEKRAPRPHITLAYLRERLPVSRLPALPDPPTDSLRFEAAHLLRTIPLGYRSWHRTALLS